MMKHRIFILLIVLTTSLFMQSCIFIHINKDIDDYPTIIEGKVVNYYTKKPIKNYLVEVVAKKSQFGGSIFYVQDTLLSDSSGRFQYSFTATNGYRYYVSAYAGKYQGLSECELNYEQTNRLNLRVKPLRYISLRLINTTDKYKRITLPNEFTYESFRFNDTTFIINHVVPDSHYKLKIGLYECENCGSYIVKSEDIWIKNEDTTYIKRKF